MIYVVAILCVLGLAIGQILFKTSSLALAQAGTFFNLRVMIALFAAMFLYGITSIAWVWVLQRIELGRVYPLMALAFVLVPIGSHFIFGERFQLQYFVGVVFIVFGIFVAVRA
ncbi:EamA family transporter [Pseudomonas sp. URMO17WK12:I12]|uniref:EamA family transporter n=1 Tax=Pseudomonas sp. URMO17WK12:I12 TaxID=1259797 RepID=UPI00047F49CB|nr:EamA family transporter [Pseudomonas sp. URMO17WK12:I12]